MRYFRLCAVAVAAALLGSCNLDLQNPNAPTENEVTNTPAGVIALATGLQGRFAVSYFNFAYMSGLVTDEFSATTAALISISDSEQGSVAPGTAVADAVFNTVYQTVRTADDLITGSNALAAQFEPGTRSGMRALAYALKAEALGEALQSYQKIPINTFRVTAPVYVGRSIALPYIRALLDTAAAEIATTAPSAFFNSNILTPGVNLPNMIALFQARYARMASDDAAALAASNVVARTGASAFSQFTFPAGGNFYSVVTGGTNGIAPRRAWRQSMTGGDQRFTWFVTPSATLTGRLVTPLDNWLRYAASTAPLPVYFPDEALLIKAEALTNLTLLTQAQAVLDSVRTDCTGGRGIDDPKACLAALVGTLTAPQLLTEIYNQRRYELLGTGLRWEDSRRRSFIRGPVAAPAIPLDGQRCWLPYSQGDRNANPNATTAVLPNPTEPAAFPSGCPTT